MTGNTHFHKLSSRLVAGLALTLSIAALTACGGPEPQTTTTRTVTTDRTAPTYAAPAQQTTTVQRTTTTAP